MVIRHSEKVVCPGYVIGLTPGVFGVVLVVLRRRPWQAERSVPPFQAVFAADPAGDVGDHQPPDGEYRCGDGA